MTAYLTPVLWFAIRGDTYIMSPYLALALYQGTTLVVPLEFVHFQRPGICLCQPRTFSPGERVFKPAETFGLSIEGFSPGGCEPALYQGTTLVVPMRRR
jgi:hypothetical protein